MPLAAPVTTADFTMYVVSCCGIGGHVPCHFASASCGKPPKCVQVLAAHAAPVLMAGSEVE